MPPLFLESSANGAAACCCGGFYILFLAVWGILGLALAIFKILMIIDCARAKFDTGAEQVVWILVILLVPVGSIIYYFAVKFSDPESPGLWPRAM